MCVLQQVESHTLKARDENGQKLLFERYQLDMHELITQTQDVSALHICNKMLLPYDLKLTCVARLQTLGLLKNQLTTR